MFILCKWKKKYLYYLVLIYQKYILKLKEIKFMQKDKKNFTKKYL